VASSGPLDQYIIEHPDYFFSKNPELALIDQDNLPILMSHIKCAAFELPFNENEIFAENYTSHLLNFLSDEKVLRKTENKYFWMSDIYPADEISLRNASPENVVIINTSNDNSVIGEVDRFSAAELVHKDAIYIHNSIQYHVDNLDWDEKKAYVHEIKADHYTDAITKTELKVLDILEEGQSRERGYKKYFGEVAVKRVTTGFKKIKFHTHENIGMGKVYLPELELQSISLWWEFPDDLFIDPYFQESVIGEGLNGIAYTLSHLIPAHIMCDSTDISVVPMVRAPFSKIPTIYVYDKYQGGIGLSKKLFQMDHIVLRAVKVHIESCACKKGCPSCIGPSLETGIFGKQSALNILNLLSLEE